MIKARTFFQSLPLILAIQGITGFTYGQTFIQGNGICTLCDYDGLGIYYPSSNTCLFVEQPSGFVKCIKDSTVNSLNSFISNQNLIYQFELNESGVFDLNNATSESRILTWRIVQIYDVNKDGNNDIIAQSTEGIYWFRNDKLGKYTKAQKLANPIKGVNWSDVQSLIPGIISCTAPDKKYNIKASIIDFRVQNKINTYNYQIRGNHSWGILLGGNNQIDQVLLTDSHQIKVKTKWCKTNFKTFNPGENTVFAIADFNQNGYADIVYSNENKIMVGLGSNANTLEFSKDLLQVEDSVFMNQLCKWSMNDAYYTKENAKNISLDWLNSGDFAFLDLNSDGFQDFIWKGEYLVAFQNNKAGGFDRYFVGGPYDPGQITSVDLNGDKLLDILIDAYDAEYAVMNLGNGFREVEIYPQGYQNGLVPVDLDEDNDLDIIILGEGRVLWSENDRGNLKPAVIFQKVNF